MCGGYLLNKSVYLLNYVETLIKESVCLVGKGVHLLYRASVAGASCHTFFRVLAQRAPHKLDAQGCQGLQFFAYRLLTDHVARMTLLSFPN